MTNIEHPKREKLAGYMRSPENNQPLLWRRIGEFAHEAFALRHGAPEHDHRPDWGKFAYRLDEHNKNVPSPAIQRETNEWIWRFAVSSRAPIITCMTYSLSKLPELDAYRPDMVYVVLDQNARSQAVNWTRRIASEFDLRYVDAKMLRDWAVSYDDIDPEFQYALQHQPDDPNAFQVLFLEN